MNLSELIKLHVRYAQVSIVVLTLLFLLKGSLYFSAMYFIYVVIAFIYIIKIQSAVEHSIDEKLCSLHRFFELILVRVLLPISLIFYFFSNRISTALILLLILTLDFISFYRMNGIKINAAANSRHVAGQVESNDSNRSNP